MAKDRSEDMNTTAQELNTSQHQRYRNLARRYMIRLRRAFSERCLNESEEYQIYESFESFSEALPTMQEQRIFVDQFKRDLELYESNYKANLSSYLQVFESQDNYSDWPQYDLF